MRKSWLENSIYCESKKNSFFSTVFMYHSLPVTFQNILKSSTKPICGYTRCYTRIYLGNMRECSYKYILCLINFTSSSMVILFIEVFLLGSKDSFLVYYVKKNSLQICDTITLKCKRQKKHTHTHRKDLFNMKM